jgi:hypothetical protein
MRKINEIGVILGRKGTGKTTLTRSLLAHAGNRRNLLLDSLREYDVGCRPDSFVDLVEYYNRVRDYHAWTICYTPISDQEVRAWWRLCRLASHAIIWAEEVDRYCSAWNINPDLKWLLNYGRHRALSLVGIARRPAAVHRDLTSQADWLVSFNTTEPRDLAYLGQFMDAGPLPSLPKFCWTMAGESRMFPLNARSCGPSGADTQDVVPSDEKDGTDAGHERPSDHGPGGGGGGADRPQ